MIGFVVLIALIAGAGAALWIFGVRGAVLKLSLAALLLGGAGYAFQGRPSLDGALGSGTPQASSVPLTRVRHAFFGEFNGSERWLLISESYARRGKSAEAAGVLANAVRKYPQDLQLSVGLANALVEQGRGLTPPAQLAFDRAEKIAPGNPATGFFLGLAMLRSGDPQGALAKWREILANAPAEASWRPIVEDGVAALSAASPQARTP